MLYDPKWQQETKADPFTLESLIAWLEKQPPEVGYDYSSSSDCMLCQYFTAVGFRDVSLSGNDFDHADGVQVFPQEFVRIARCLGQETFGAALERARALQAKR